jgi:tetratricopeptide (TPR) repeat protein
MKRLTDYCHLLIGEDDMKRYDDSSPVSELSPEAVQSQVERILASEKFSRAKRLRSLLRFTVAQTLQGNADQLKEYVIGTEVLKKPESYDPRSDSLVRVMASRLRIKLKEYYSNGGNEDPLVIEFPKGKYIPRFQRREQVQSEVEKRLRARNAFSQGRFIAAKVTEQALAESAAHFEEAIDADPAWFLPHAALAKAYAFEAFLGFRRPREMWPLVKSQTETTLGLDDMSADAHICLGMESAFFGWRWHEAEAHFHKAIERDAYCGSGHLWHALGFLIPHGRLEDARAELQEAHRLAPALFLEEASVLASYLGEKYEDVLRDTQRSTEALPGWMPWMRSCALAGLGQTSAAIERLSELDREEPDQTPTLSMMGYVYGITGHTEQAREVLDDLRRKRDGGAWIPNYDLAVVEAGLGNHEDALAWLQEALREKEPWMAFLALDPRMSPLRSHPKFTAFTRRILSNSD